MKLTEWGIRRKSKLYHRVVQTYPTFARAKSKAKALRKEYYVIVKKTNTGRYWIFVRRKEWVK
jgi:hypothetical protein